MFTLIRITLNHCSNTYLKKCIYMTLQLFKITSVQINFKYKVNQLKVKQNKIKLVFRIKIYKASS